jgi:hypothetical protein
MNHQGNLQGVAKKRKKKKKPTAPTLGQVGFASASGQAMIPQKYVPDVYASAPPLVQPVMPTRCRGAPWRTIPSSSFVWLFYKKC